jgi:hypothetical protein
LRSSPFRVRTPNARRKSRTATKNKTLIFSLKLAKQKTLLSRPSVSKKITDEQAKQGFPQKRKKNDPTGPNVLTRDIQRPKPSAGRSPDFVILDFGFWILD